MSLYCRETPSQRPSGHHPERDEGPGMKGKKSESRRKTCIPADPRRSSGARAVLSGPPGAASSHLLLLSSGLCTPQTLSDQRLRLAEVAPRWCLVGK